MHQDSHSCRLIPSQQVQDKSIDPDPLQCPIKSLCCHAFELLPSGGWLYSGLAKDSLEEPCWETPSEPHRAQKSNMSPESWSRALYLHLLPPGVHADGEPPNAPPAGDINSWTTAGSITARELRDTQLETLEKSQCAGRLGRPP